MYFCACNEKFEEKYLQSKEKPQNWLLTFCHLNVLGYTVDQSSGLKATTYVQCRKFFNLAHAGHMPVRACMVS